MKIEIGLSYVLSILALVLALAAVGLSVAHFTIYSTQTQPDIQTMIQTLKEQVASLNNSVVLELASIKADVGAQADDLRDLVDTVQTLIYETGSLENPAQSCNEISTDRLSGLYWIRPDNASSPVQVYCDTNRTSCSCGSTEGWMRVANVDMRDPNQTCPDGFRLITTPRRVCGRPNDLIGCVSTTFPVHGIKYSQVCGKIIGYQIGLPDAFVAHPDSVNGLEPQGTIDDYYLDGISLTHGQSPRQHIWSFAAAVGDDYNTTRFLCPCTRTDITYEGTVPPFIGTDYFCDTGGATMHSGFFYADDPLWNGQGCAPASTCCSFNNPPWFCKQLPQPTTDDIELRICDNQVISFDDIPFETVELYVI